MDDVINRHVYPDPVNRLFGEALMATVLIGSGLKFDGKLILQLQDSSKINPLNHKQKDQLFGNIKIPCYRIYDEHWWD